MGWHNDETPPKASISQPGSVVEVHPATEFIATTSSIRFSAAASSSFNALLLIALRCFISVSLARSDVTADERRVLGHDPGVNLDAEVDPVTHQFAVVISRVRRIAIAGVTLVVAAAGAQIADLAVIAARVAAVQALRQKVVEFLGHALTGGIAMAGMFAYIAGSPFVFIKLYGVPAEHYGWLFGSNAAGFILVAQVNARLLAKRQPAFLLARTVWIYLAAGVALLGISALHTEQLWPLLIPLFICIASLGCIIPNASACATHGPRAFLF